MKVRRAVIYTILLLILALSVAIVSSMLLFMIPAIVQIEQREASESVLRAVRVLDNELGSIEGSVLDWARWDETYFFARDRNPEYIANNLMNSTFTSLNLDLVLFYDNEGNLFYGKGYDYIEQSHLDIPEDILVNPARESFVLMHKEPGDTGGSLRGILRSHEGLLLMAVSPILRSDSSGPIAGYLCMGRFLDTSEIEKIAHLTSTNLSFLRPNEALSYESSMQGSYAGGENLKSVQVTSNGNTLTSTLVMADINGRPDIVLRVDSARSTYNIAVESLNLSLLLIVLIGTITVISALYSLDRSFLSRLSLLERKVTEIAGKQDFSARTELSGDDELAGLSARIDDMLSALEDHIAAEHRAVEQVRIVNEKLENLSKITRHDILNQISVIRGFADLSRDCIGPGSPAAPYIDRIITASAAIEEQLQFTRDYELGGVHADPAWFNVQDLARGVARKIGLGNVRLEITTGDLEVYADPLLERIIYNLVDNSLKHGESVTRIGLGFREEGEEGILVYEDDGVGISIDQKERIFEEGIGRHMGLGLFLTRGILSVTGIRIREAGIPGKGALFEIHIPRGKFRWSGKEYG